jgi:hypothetical protein
MIIYTYNIIFKNFNFKPNSVFFGKDIQFQKKNKIPCNVLWIFCIIYKN